MSKIGEEWHNGKLSIATEHVASNVAQTLVKIIMEQVSGSGNLLFVSTFVCCIKKYMFS